ncbi:MAG: Hpt domain-containing protein [Acidobacteriota bacterium]
MVRKVDQEVLLGFVEEARSYLPKVLECIEILKKDATDLSALEEAHRLFHSIKGASSMVGLSALSHVAYCVEETLEEIGAEQLEFNDTTVELLVTTIAQIETYLDGVVSGTLDEHFILADVTERFHRLRGLPELANKTPITKPPIDISEPPTLREEKVFKPQTKELVSATPESKDEPIDIASSELMEAFLQEAEDHLQNIFRALRSLAQNPQQKDLIQEVRRSAHTLKGASGMVGLRSISQLSHRMEDVLDGLYEGSITLSPEIISLFFDTCDILEDLVHNSGDDIEDRIEEAYHSYSTLLDQLTPTEVAPSSLTKSTAKLEPLGAAGTIDLTTFPRAVEKQEEVTSAEKAEPTLQQTSNIVRVPIERLDELVRLVSELVVNRSMFEQYFRGLIREVDELKLSVGRLQRIAGKLEAEYEVAALGKGMAALYSMAATGNALARSLSKPSLGGGHGFDELEFDRYTEFHLLTRELTETTSDISALGSELSNTIGDFDSYLTGQGQLTSEVQDKLMRLRMVPLATLASKLHRTVRVTASQQGKQVNLTIEGERVELDKTVLEELADPLLHILRNAVDHGIEPPALRQAMGKPKVGEIRLHAHYATTQVVIQVSDDGAGLEPELIRTAALRGGYITEAEAETLTDEDLYSFIFLPGFSTATEISEISGRGVGLDIVKATVSKMKGTITANSTPGVGVIFTIRLPLTLAITRVILVKANNEIFALPLAAVTRILRVERDEIELIGQKSVVRVEGVVYPTIRLAEALNLKQPADDSVRRLPVLILNLAERQVALIVDHLVEAREVVVKSMGNLLQRAYGVAGATLMGDGSVVLILNPNELIQEDRPRESSAKVLLKAVREQARRVLNVLIVDDSVSVRRVLSNLARRAGWNPIEAKDGVEALETIQSSAKNPDIILLDIEMPRMDGYELTATLRANNAYKNIPIVMLTSRAGEKHKQKALDLGATEYLVKPYQEEVLLNVVRRLT